MICVLFHYDFSQWNKLSWFGWLEFIFLQLRNLCHIWRCWRFSQIHRAICNGRTAGGVSMRSKWPSTRLKNFTCLQAWRALGLLATWYLGTDWRNQIFWRHVSYNLSKKKMELRFSFPNWLKNPEVLVCTLLYYNYSIWCVSCTVVVLTYFGMRGFCNVWVFWELCVCFGNMCTCIYCVLCCLYCVFVLFILCIFIFVLSILV